MERKDCIFLIDSRGIFNLGDSELLNRHLNYANKLNQIVNAELTILTSSFNLNKEWKKEKLTIHHLGTNKRFSFKYIFNSIREINKVKYNKIALIAGDANEAFVNALIIKYFTQIKTKKNLKIQVQIHSDLFNPSFRKFSLTNRLRYLIGRTLISKADQIRMVGITQSKYLTNEIPKLEKRIFVAPVSLSGNFKGKINKNSNKVIGFIGRIDSDRGISDLIKFAKLYLSQDVENKLLIAGKGKLEELIKIELLKYIKNSQCIMMGFLNENELEYFWNKISCSIFFAEFESFGRGMWESIMNNVPVVSLINSGANDLGKLTSGNSVHLIKSVEESLKAINFSESIIDQKSKLALGNYLESSQKLLIKNWANMVNQ